MKNEKLNRILDQMFDSRKPGTPSEFSETNRIEQAWGEWKGDHSRDNPFLWTRIEAKLSNDAPAIISKLRLAWVAYASVIILGITIGISIGNTNGQDAVEEFSTEYLIDSYDYDQFTEITMSENELLYQE